MKELKELISIRLKPELLKQIDSIAGPDIRTRTNMIEKLLDEAIKNRDNNKYNKVKDD